MNDFRLTVRGFQEMTHNDLIVFWANPFSLIVPAAVLALVIIVVSHMWKRK